MEQVPVSCNRLTDMDWISINVVSLMKCVVSDILLLGLLSRSLFAAVTTGDSLVQCNVSNQYTVNSVFNTILCWVNVKCDAKYCDVKYCPPMTPCALFSNTRVAC